MTRRKTLKERVRERQQKTGERYTTALAHLKAHAAAAPAPGEPIDVTWLARELGLACRASLSERLARGTAAQRERRFRLILDGLKALLLALDGDAGAAKLAEVLLRGEPGPPVSANGIAEAIEARGFLEQVAQGRRGVSANGRLAAFDADGQPVIATVLWHSTRPAFLYLAPLDEASTGPWTHSFALAGLGGGSRR